MMLKVIDKAKAQFSLLKALHDALPQEQRSEKTQIVYTHVFEEVYQHYKQIEMSDIAQHSSTRRKPPTRDDFQIDIGLIQAEQEVDLSQSNRPGCR
jgi:hypothetical protein